MKKIIPVLSIVIITLGVGIGGYYAYKYKPTTNTAQSSSTSLATPPEGGSAFITNKADGQYMVVNGKESGPYTTEQAVMPDAGPHNFHTLGDQMIWRTTREGRNVVILNWKELGPFEETISDVSFINGKPIYILKKEDPNSLIIKDGVTNKIPYKKIIPAFDYIKRTVALYEGDVVMKGTNDNSHWDVLIGTKKIAGPFASEPSVFINAQNQVVVESFQSNEAPATQYLVYSKGKLSQLTEEEYKKQNPFTPAHFNETTALGKADAHYWIDDTRVLYLVPKDTSKKVYNVVHDNKIIGTTEEIFSSTCNEPTNSMGCEKGDFHFEHNVVQIGDRFAFVAKQKGKYFVQNGSEQIGPFDEAGFLQASGDQLMFLAEKDGKGYVYGNSELSEPFNAISSIQGTEYLPLPSPKMAHGNLYFVGRIGDQDYIFKDGVKNSKPNWHLEGPYVVKDIPYFTTQEFGEKPRSIIIDENEKPLTLQYSSISVIQNPDALMYEAFPYPEWEIHYGDSVKKKLKYDEIWLQYDQSKPLEYYTGSAQKVVGRKGNSTIEDVLKVEGL